MLVMAVGPVLVLLVGLFTSGAALAAALVVAFALVAVGGLLLVKAMRSEPKIRPHDATR